MATIRDVAHRAQVAPMTVSRVLNNPDSVSLPTRDRVEAAIRELSYIPNMVGQALRNNTTGAIGLVVSDITNHFAIDEITGVSDAARDKGFSVVFAHTESDSQEELRQIRSMIERRVDGIILSPVHNGPESVDFVQKAQRPVAVIGYPMPKNDVDIVRCDSVISARGATEHLIGLGHTRIVMLSGPAEIVTAAERAEGYEEAMSAAGLRAITRYGAFTPRSGNDMAAEILAQGIRPTAFVTANNFIAMGAAHAAKKLGLSIPGDISITTFDNSGSDLVLDPFFTGVVQPVSRMAALTTELLLDRVAQRYSGVGREIVLPTSFEIHGSTAPPPVSEASRY
ncbi:LacI family DNA-binding transcriptional regulator [Salinibacterium sp. NK8237]|uniref:LacI family DNA-binding transcriptional regulator n=1 Tax=Salinibacterium sp. NK8237 TaxID=2792038 RepID=UPI0018CF6BCF|nr:LacI family DNA-binding transcriptional regulator [Salinibacterium sp. NK8237]MBH0130630.1 LacI family DNA-binding transcriptional regulator [Salinibacterium sp. NK8237]